MKLKLEYSGSSDVLDALEALQEALPEFGVRLVILDGGDGFEEVEISKAEPSDVPKPTGIRLWSAPGPWRAPLQTIEQLTERCHGARDGECFWRECPQIRDGEPHNSGRHCPLDTNNDDA